VYTEQIYFEQAAGRLWDYEEPDPDESPLDDDPDDLPPLEPGEPMEIPTTSEEDLEELRKAARTFVLPEEEE